MTSGERISKVQRWLDLIAFLLGKRRPVTVDEIFEAVPAYGRGRAESARRMFERDKDELRQQGIAIQTESFATSFGTEHADGYVLRADDFFVPYLSLVDEGRRQRRDGSAIEFSASDAELILRALAEARDLPGSPFSEATRRAYRKLGFDLAPGTGSDLEAPAVPVFLPGRSEVAEVARFVSGALQRRQRIRFRYHGAQRGVATERDVAPYGMLMEGGAWYFVGHDALRQDLRVFHLGRMEMPRIADEGDEHSTYAIPEDFDISAYRDSWAAHPERDRDGVVIDVLFDGPWARWAARNHHGIFVRQEGGGAIRRFTVQDLEPFCDWVLGLVDRARVVSPEDVAEKIRERAVRIAAAHG